MNKCNDSLCWQMQIAPMIVGALYSLPGTVGYQCSLTQVQANRDTLFLGTNEAHIFSLE